MTSDAAGQLHAVAGASVERLYAATDGGLISSAWPRTEAARR